MAEKFNIQHKLTDAYSPCFNGTMERLTREILALMRTLLGELLLALQDWNSIFDILQAVLNEAPEERLEKIMKTRRVHNRRS